MNKILILFTLLAMTFLTSLSCALFNTTNPVEGVFINNTDEHVYQTIYSAQGSNSQLTSNRVLKKGEDCATEIPFVQFFVRYFDQSVLDAMKKGGITKPAVVDRASVKLYVPVYGNIWVRNCVVVWGE